MCQAVNSVPRVIDGWPFRVAVHHLRTYRIVLHDEISLERPTDIVICKELITLAEMEGRFLASMLYLQCTLCLIYVHQFHPCANN